MELVDAIVPHTPWAAVWEVLICFGEDKCRGRGGLKQKVHLGKEKSHNSMRCALPVNAVIAQQVVSKSQKRVRTSARVSCNRSRAPPVGTGGP